VVPDRNKKDLGDIPKALRRRLRWVIVKNMSEVAKIALLARENSAGRAARSDTTRRPIKSSKRRSWKRGEKSPQKNQRERPVPLRP
jgi:Lon protease (S16) C-terminal proteolytic domain